jgi:hypothetical protein
VFGDWATKLLSKFPVNETQNSGNNFHFNNAKAYKFNSSFKTKIETDTRRLEFIANWFEEIIINESKEYEKQNPENKQSDFNQYFLKDLLDYRKLNTEMCNMILVLLVVCRISYSF